MLLRSTCQRHCGPLNLLLQGLHLLLCPGQLIPQRLLLHQLLCADGAAAVAAGVLLLLLDGLRCCIRLPDISTGPLTLAADGIQVLLPGGHQLISAVLHLLVQRMQVHIGSLLLDKLLLQPAHLLKHVVLGVQLAQEVHLVPQAACLLLSLCHPAGLNLDHAGLEAELAGADLQGLLCLPAPLMSSPEVLLQRGALLLGLLQLVLDAICCLGSSSSLRCAQLLLVLLDHRLL